MKYYDRLANDIVQLISKNKLEDLRLQLNSRNILELTQIFSRLTKEHQKIILEKVSAEKSARILKLSLRFEHKLSPILSELESQKLAEYLSYCEPDDAKEILHLISPEKESDVFSRLNTNQVNEIKKLETYPVGTAGSLMNPHFIALEEKMTVSESLKMIQEHAEAEMVFYLYVVDKNHMLKGVVSLRKLVTSPSHQSILNIMVPTIVSATVNQSFSEVADIFEKSGFLALPVLDLSGRLVGMISRDDVMEKVQADTERTLLNISGVSLEELHGAPVYRIVPLRLPWLTASIVGGLLNAFILNQYTNILSEVIALTLYIPVLLGLGETVGTQTSTLIIRGLALGDLENNQFKKLVFNEILTGFILGFLSGAIIGIVNYFWFGTFVIGQIILISVTLAITTASLVGTLTPLAFKLLKIDPALASSAFVLTGSDLFTIIIYLTISTQFLK